MKRSEKIRGIERIDLSQFGGRVYESKNVHPGTFALSVSFSEALKFGNDAILSYDEEALHIWKPDGVTKEVFSHSARATVSDDGFYGKVSYDPNSKEIIIKKYRNEFYYMFIGFLEILVAIFVLIIGILSIKVES